MIIKMDNAPMTDEKAIGPDFVSQVDQIHLLLTEYNYSLFRTLDNVNNRHFHTAQTLQVD